MNIPAVVYKDLDLSLTLHPASDDVLPKINREAIKRSLYNLLRWTAWTIPFDPKSGNFISETLFENLDLLTAVDVRDRVSWLIKTHEPRCTVIDISVQVNSEDSGFDVTIKYNIKSLSIVESMSISLTPIR